MKKIILCLFISQGLFCQNNSMIKEAELFGISEARLKYLNKVMHSFVDNGKISCIQTAIMRRGKLVHFDTYGFKDIKSKLKLKSDDIFRIYSMTKPIVSVALMTLFEEGKFQLYDPIDKYIPELKKMKVYDNGRFIDAKNKIKIIDLLRHTSGLGYFSNNVDQAVDSLYNEIDFKNILDNNEFISKIKNIPLNFDPGTDWKYGLSTNVIGYLIEVLSGMGLDEYLEWKIFKPLSMKDTSFEVPIENYKRLVTEYTLTKQRKLKPIDQTESSRFTKKVTHFSGGGGLVSTMDDYLIFSQMLLNNGSYKNNRILSPKTIQMMTSDHLNYIFDKEDNELLIKGTSFGLGFAVTTDVSETNLLGSKDVFGWGGAAGTFFRIDPKENLIFIMMIQIKPYKQLQIREYFQNMVYQSLTE